MIDSNLVIIVNTHSSCYDIWPMFFGQLRKCFGADLPKVYVFSDVTSNLFTGFEVVLYDKSADFRTQYLSCLRQVKEPYCLNMNDDYMMYDHPDIEAIEWLAAELATSEFSQVRLMRGPNFKESPVCKPNLHSLDSSQEYFYSQTPAIWKVNDLRHVHELCPPAGIGRKNPEELQLETVANHVCRKLQLTGLCYYNGEPKRGMAHYDSSVLPHICSALVGGKWNMREYPDELFPLLKQYKINPNDRGLF